MRNHKVVLLLMSLEKKTIRKLEKFLQSEYPVFPEKSVALGTYILQCHPDYDSAHLSEKKLLASIGVSPEKPNAKHELTRSLSDFLAALEHFVATEALAENQHMKGSLVADFYYQSQNVRGLSKTIKQNDRMLEKVQKKESAIHLYAYLNHKLAHNFEKQKKNLKGAQSHIVEAATDLNTYFMIQLFQAGIGYIQATYNPPPIADFPLLTASLNYVDRHQEGVMPLLELWKLAYELTLEPQKNAIYDLLKKRLLEDFESIHAVDANSFVTILSNALRSQIHLGRKRYLEEQLNLYEIEIREGWLIVNGIMGYVTFNNIIAISLMLGKTAFAQKFIKDHSIYILPVLREQILTYNRARIAFSKQQFLQALQLSQMVGYFDDSVSLGIKRIQCMCYYELGDIDALHDVWNAYKMALYRTKKISPIAKDANKQFLKIMSILLKGPDPGKASDFWGEIQNTITDYPFLPELEWVQEQLPD